MLGDVLADYRELEAHHISCYTGTRDAYTLGHRAYVLRISKSLLRIRKAQSEKRDRMYTYFKEIDHVFRFALYGCVAKIWKSSI